MIFKTHFSWKQYLTCKAGIMTSLPKKPAIDVISSIPNLYRILRAVMPSDVTITNVEISGLNSKLNIIRKSEIILSDPCFLPEVFNNAEKLKWAHCTWAGIEDLAHEVRKSRAIPSFPVTRHGGSAFSQLMAEYVLCQILNWEKRMLLIWRNQMAETWTSKENFESCRSLRELVICILGVGNMGCAIAKCLKSLGSNIIGFCSTPRKEGAFEYEYFNRIETNLSEVLAECNCLCNTLPSTPETSGLLNNNVLSLCCKKPFFINVGRGNIIQEKFLIDALRNEWISGAVLDVFEEEPLPKESVLWHMPQVIVTPHVAALSKPEHIVEEFLDNYQRFTGGEVMKNVVKWSTGY